MQHSVCSVEDHLRKVDAYTGCKFIAHTVPKLWPFIRATNLLYIVDCPHN